MISTRNATRTLIVGKHAVPVRQVTESVCERRNFDWIQTRYPVSTADIFECIDAVADIDKFGKGTHLKLENVGTEEDDLLIKVLSISDICYLKVLQFGRVYLNSSIEMEEVFDKGLVMLAYLSFKDIAENTTAFIESDPLSEIVLDAFRESCVDYNDEMLYNILKDQVENEAT